MYEGLAKFYDEYTADMDRKKLLKFILACFKKYGNRGIKMLSMGEANDAAADGTDIDNSKLVIDVGCGTGVLTCMMAELGFDMTGLDLSPEMLYKAEENAGKAGVSPMWLCQDMTKIDTYGSYAAMICTYDGVNHLTTRQKLHKFLSRSINFVDPGGLLIFDYLTPEYFKNRIDGKINVDDGEEGTCIWQGKYDEKKETCCYGVTCYNQTDEGLYERVDDVVVEKAWTQDIVNEELANAGYKILKITGVERITVVAKKSRKVK